MTSAQLVKRAFGKPDFVAAALVLGIAALGMNFAINYLKVVFHKQPVEMRCSRLDGADGIPERLGDWVQISSDKPLDPDTEHVLGTTKYLQRRYANRIVFGSEMLNRVANASDAERIQIIGQMMSAHPEAVIDVGVFYYTGFVDTVAHIPERCYIADGFDIKNQQVLQGQPLGKRPDGSPRTVDLSFLSFEDISGRNRLPTNVAYLFHVDGHYEASSVGVRTSLMSLFEKYAYYCKVEVKTIALPGTSGTAESREQALASMRDFLGSMLPEIERIMPDWNGLHQAGVR